MFFTKPEVVNVDVITLWRGDRVCGAAFWRIPAKIQAHFTISYCDLHTNSYAARPVDRRADTRSNNYGVWGFKNITRR